MNSEKDKTSVDKICSSSCDIYEEDGKVVCRIEMPGVSKEDLDVQVEDERLVISGKKKLDHPEGSFKIREIRDGVYHHEFTIDDTIDRSSIDAAIKNGILTIIMKIKESEKPRKIKVISD